MTGSPLPPDPDRLGYRWRVPRVHASVRGRLLGLLLLAATPVVLLALAGTYSGYTNTLAQALDDLGMERDLLLRRIVGRLDMADATLRVLAALPDAGTACNAVTTMQLPEGLTIRVAQPGAAAPRCVAGAASPIPATVAMGQDRLVTSHGGHAVLTRQAPAGWTLSVDTALAEPPAGLLAWLVGVDGQPWPIGNGGPPGHLAWQHGEPDAWTSDGTRLIAASAPIENSVLVVARPAAPSRRAALIEGLTRLGEVVALLALSAAAVLLGAGYAVTRPLMRLRRAVTQWRHDGTAFEPPDRAGMPDEIRDLADSFVAGAEALAARERELQSAMDRAEILAAEVHHRVKNNLQIVSSLLALQAQRVTDPAARAEFESARDRIGAIATLHRHMYVHHDPEAIDLGAFIEELGLQLFAAVGDRPGRRIALDVDAPALRISSDQAVPLALIITEAVSAALKQGFPPSRGGRIGIRVEATERRAKLVIADDGVTPRSDDQLRGMLLRGLARQLGGELRREEAGLTLDFPLRAPLPRLPVSVRPK